MKENGPFHENQVFVLDDEVHGLCLSLSPHRVKRAVLMIVQDGWDFGMAGLILLTGVTGEVDKPKLKFPPCQLCLPSDAMNIRGLSRVEYSVGDARESGSNVYSNHEFTNNPPIDLW